MTPELIALIVILLCALVQWAADRSASRRRDSKQGQQQPQGPRRVATSYERAAEAQWREQRGAL